MMAVVFEDHCVSVKDSISSRIEAVLEECIGEIEAQTKLNSAVGKGGGAHTKNSWKHTVYSVANGYEAVVGSDSENAIWEEFGTGEYALEGNGRKGGWYIPLGPGGMSEDVAREYGFTIFNGKDGKKYVHTVGKKPKRMLFRAFTSLKSSIIAHIKSEIGSD